MKVEANKKNASSSKSADNSSAEDEDSDSFSDDSSSADSKISKNQKRKVPQFSVSQSDTGGLRMKISAIHRTTTSTTTTSDEKINNKRKSPTNNNIRNSEKLQQQNNITVTGKQNHQSVKRKLSTISSSSCCSVCSQSESECSSEIVKKEKPKKLRIKRKKVNSEIIHEVKCNSVSTDSDCDIERSNNKVTSKTQNEQNRQQDKNNSPSTSITTTSAEYLKTTTASDVVTTEALPGGSCVSSSDTELPAAINAAIKCVESCSDDESENPKQQYTSTLLRDFMVKTTQILGGNTGNGNGSNNGGGGENEHRDEQQQSSSNKKSLPTSVANNDINGNTNLIASENSTAVAAKKSPVQQQQQQQQTRKKRGRPKKNSVIACASAISAVESIVNESADSGITSVTQSLSPSPKNHYNHHHHHNSSLSNFNSGFSGNGNNTTSTNQINNKVSSSTKTTKEQNIQQHQQQRERSNTPINKSFHQHQHHKLNMVAGNLDKIRYAVTERVLYPQREKKKQSSSSLLSSLMAATSSQKHQNTKSSLFPSSNALATSRQSQKSNEIADDIRRSPHSSSNHIDPLWKKIDVNMKFRRPSLSGYKSDGGGGGTTICSKILAARSGYVSDYGSVIGSRNYSGYKSDVSGKSRSSMRSCVSRAKSCVSMRSRRLGGRRRRLSTSSSHHHLASTTKNSGNMNLMEEQDILQLAGLSLGQSSEESSRESICKNPFPKDKSKLYGEINRFITTGEYFGRSKQSHSISFGGISARHSSNNGNDFFSGIIGGAFSGENASTRGSSSNLLFSKDFERFSKRIRSRRSSAVSRCSSSYSVATTRHGGGNRRKRRRKLRYYNRLQSRNGYIDSKLNTEIEILINSFSMLCKITFDKNSTLNNKDNSSSTTREKSEKDKTNERGSKTQSKRSQKKKKQIEHANEHHHHQHHPSNTTLKRRHKKTAHASPDDHKLPLKKRHYLLTPGEKSASADGKNVNNSSTDAKIKDVTNVGETVKSSSGKGSSGGTSGSGKSGSNVTGGSKTTIVTPKKRHLLETTNSGKEENVSATTKTHQSSSSSQSGDSKVSASAKANESDSNTSTGQQKPQHANHHVKGDALTKKKNRLEGLLSKIQNANSSSTSQLSPSGASKDSSSSSSTGKSFSNNNESVQTQSSFTTTCHPPPGVFEPTIELEIQIPLVKLATDGIISAKSEVESPKVSDLMDVDKLLPAGTAGTGTGTATTVDTTKIENTCKGVIENLLNKSTTGILLLKRKRKKPINRTGFPSLKKKKRKVIDKNVVPTTDVILKNENNLQKKSISTTNNVLSEMKSLKKVESSCNNGVGQEQLCDRVPHAGEASDTFLQRNNKVPRLSVVSLERLQEPQKKRDTTTTSATSISSVDQQKVVNETKAAITSVTAGTKLGKNNLRGSPNHRATTVSNIVKAEIKMKEKAATVRRKKTTETPKDKRASPRSPRTVTPSKVATTGNNSEVPTIKPTKKNSNFSENITNSTKSLQTENNKAKRLTTKSKTTSVVSKNKNSISSSSKSKTTTTTTKNKILDTKEEEAKTKSNKKLKTEAQQTQKSTTKSEAGGGTSTKSTSKKKPNESQSKSTLNGAHKKITKKETTTTTTTTTPTKPTSDSPTPSMLSHPNIEELEQEPLPPLELNDNGAVDSADETTTVVDESDSTVRGGRKTAKWKKNYLTAGLFSNYYKVNKTRKNKADKENGSTSGASDTSSIVGGSANAETGSQLTTTAQQSLLPPPPYCEKFFRRTIQDFLLPYDVWWAYKNSKLPTKAMVPSWNYKKIRTNVYGDLRPNLVFDQQQCTCKPESGCGDDCLNRMVYAECSQANCPCGDKCRNQKIQKHDISPGIERFMTQNKGWGVRTALPIRKGTYILEYVGEVVTEKEFKERMATLYANDTHHYCLHLDGGLVIDGHRMGSDGRFVNHSCSPNCEMQKWSVNGLSRMALFALRDINSGEELTYDYNFSLFNPSEGQLCRCETPQCRGVIGGKSQRVKPFEQKNTEIVPSLNSHSRSRKRQARKNSGRIQSKDFVTTNLQQPSDREKKIIKSKNCFLMRNLEKVRRLKMKSLVKSSNINTNATTTTGTSSRPSTPSSLAAQISALLRVPRNSVQTRVLTQAVTDPEVEKMAKLAAILREICVALEGVKDDEEKPLIVKLTASSKKKQSSSTTSSSSSSSSSSSQDYHRTFATKSIDFSTVQSNVEKGHYKTPESFDEDVNTVFANAINYFEPGAEETLIVKRLSKEYTEKKKQLYNKLVELLGEKSSKCFRITNNGKGTGVYNTHEDVIRCICGLYKDEGLMIQCSKCLVWQHTECTKANINEDNYLCERCEPRKVDLEIPLDEFTEENYRYYLSLLRGNLQIRQSDTVYVLRDIPIKDVDGKILTTKKHTYETIGKIDYSECDIFRVERLWKDNDGKRFIFGHHYLRPHETFHEPSRKFYDNEVVRVPLYEVIPIELVIARCWVLDRKTFCMGRPVDCISEDHVYICELRVNKTARLFAKNKQSYPICTKNYAFRRFKDKLHISRTYAPHDVDPSLLKMKKRKTNDTSSSTSSSSAAPVSSSTQQQQQQLQQQNQQQQQQQNQKDKKNSSGPIIHQLMPPPAKTINEKRTRLENILKNLRLKNNQTSSTTTPPLDLSYLLTGRGARQRRANATIVPL